MTEILRAMLCAFLVVSVALSKPVCLNGGEESSEASDSNSSEEAVGHSETSESTQPELVEPEAPSSLEETDPPKADPALSSQDANPSALPNTVTADPQTSTDIDPLPLVPESNPPQTSLGTEISQDIPETDPSHDAVNADLMHVLPDALASESPVFTETVFTPGGVGTDRPHIKITTFQVFPQDSATPQSPDITPTPPALITALPWPAAAAAATAAVPVCFTVHINTPAPLPSRGDSV